MDDKSMLPVDRVTSADKRDNKFYINDIKVNGKLGRATLASFFIGKICQMELELKDCKWTLVKVTTSET